MNTSGPVLRAPEAARYLGLSKSTLAKWRMSGNGPRYVKLGARVVAYSQDELDRWRQSRTRTSTSEH